MLIIPTQPLANATLTTVINDITCQINIYQKSTGLFVDLGIAGTLVLAGVLAHDRRLLVIDDYFGWPGDLAFFDMQGTQDPDYTGLGSRYFLGSYQVSELPVPLVGSLA